MYQRTLQNTVQTIDAEWSCGKFAQSSAEKIQIRNLFSQEHSGLRVSKIVG